jgi:hypothetical protein
MLGRLQWPRVFLTGTFHESAWEPCASFQRDVGDAGTELETIMTQRTQRLYTEGRLQTYANVDQSPVSKRLVGMIQWPKHDLKGMCGPMGKQRTV